MSDQLRAWLRTTIPTAWSALVAYLVTAGAPDWITGPLGDAGPTIIVPLALAGIYAALRAVEPHLPPWATRLLLGSNTPPTYPPASSTPPQG